MISNITAVDGGSTASYVYDALNNRVRTTVGSAVTEFVFDQNGRRASEWNGATRANLKGPLLLGRIASGLLRRWRHKEKPGGAGHRVMVFKKGIVYSAAASTALVWATVQSGAPTLKRAKRRTVMFSPSLATF